MPVKPRTDREISTSGKEFVWDVEGHTEAHQYLSRPILNWLKARHAGKVLDLGCGNGSLTSYLSLSGYDVVGLDHSLSGIEIAKRQFPHIPFFQHDLHTPLPAQHLEQYDAVVSAEVIEHLFLPRKLMEAAHAALRPRGVFILTTPFHGYWKNLALALTNQFDLHWHPLRDYGHIKFFSKNTIMALFAESGFSQLHFETAGRIPAVARSMIVCGSKL